MRSGRLLGLLGILIYVIFTLLPDSSTQMVLWPWVLIWQAGLLCFVLVAVLNLWQTRQPFFLLGNNLDWAIALCFITLCLSATFATFPHQALWYSLIAFACLIMIYVGNNYLQATKNLDGLLTLQGCLSVALIVESLLLWTAQVLLPRLSELDQLSKIGINLTYDFSDIEARNAFPLGHQNYVAGYLMIALPLLTSLAITQSGIRRKIWLVGIALGLVDLYTTSSRGGFLGLFVLIVVGILIMLVRSRGQRLAVIVGGASTIGAIATLIIFNNRLQNVLNSLLSGKGGGDLFYRIIAAAAGWKIGLAHWLFGAAPGAAMLFYQQYRPAWAAREAEMMFQLHSTPVQLWAELGSAGAVTVFVATLGLLVLLIRLHFSATWLGDRDQQIVTYGLFGGLLAYGTLALTDYQLDVFAISGSLIIITACIAYIGQLHINYPKQLIMIGNYPRLRQWLAGTTTVFVCAAIAWLAPVDVAWQSSSIGFNFLDRMKLDLQTGNVVAAENNLQRFQQQLEQAHRLASWEPYYPYQLGWNLADLGLRTTEPQQAQKLQQAGLVWLQKANKISPYQEFGYNAAAWVSLVQQRPQAAEVFFRRALALVPAKRSLFFGLGVSLLRQGKMDAGLRAISLECLNDPIFLTTPLWSNPEWQKLKPQVAKQLDSFYASLIKSTPELKTTQAVVDWWLGEPNTIAALATSKSPIAAAIAATIQNKPDQLSFSFQDLHYPWQMAIAAWFTPSERQLLLEMAWATANRSVPNQESAVVIKAMVDRMNQSPNFDAWLRQPLPANSPLISRFRRARVGFGVVSRHIDGEIPLDFFNVEENVIITKFFAELFPTQGGLVNFNY